MIIIKKAFAIASIKTTYENAVFEADGCAGRMQLSNQYKKYFSKEPNFNKSIAIRFPLTIEKKVFEFRIVCFDFCAHLFLLH